MHQVVCPTGTGVSSEASICRNFLRQICARKGWAGARGQKNLAAARLGALAFVSRHANHVSKLSGVLR